MCCQVSKAPPPPLTCTVTMCTLDPESCDQDGGKDEWGNPLRRRDSTISAAAGFSHLEKRGGKRPFTWKTAAGLFITQYSLTYPTPSAYMRNLQGSLQGIANRWWQIRSQYCEDPVVTPEPLESGQGPPDTAQVEHTVPLVAIARFAAVANHGQQWAPRPAGYRRSNRNGGWIEVGQITPEGPPTRTPAITDSNFWQNVWNDGNGLPAGLAPVTPTSPELRRPVDRLYEAAGSNNNAAHFTMLQSTINGAKGMVEVFKSPMDPATLRTHVADSLDPTETEPITSVMSFMAPLRELRGMFEYLNSPDVVTRLDTTSAAILSQLQVIEQNVPAAQGYVILSFG